MEKTFDWNTKKNSQLKEERGITFEAVVQSLNNEGLLDNIQHPVRQNQRMFIVEIFDYAYVVPYIEESDRYFLKTIYPSRKHTKKYLEKK